MTHAEPKVEAAAVHGPREASASPAVRGGQRTEGHHCRAFIAAELATMTIGGDGRNQHTGSCPTGKTQKSLPSGQALSTAESVRLAELESVISKGLGVKLHAPEARPLVSRAEAASVMRVEPQAAPSPREAHASVATLSMGTRWRVTGPSRVPWTRVSDSRGFSRCRADSSVSTGAPNA